MALKIVQSVTTPLGSVASFTQTFASAPTPGNAVIVGASTDAQVVTSVVDNQGNTFLDAANTNTDGGNVASIWYIPALGAVTAPYTVTVTLAAAASSCASMHEVSGPLTFAPLDVSANKLEQDGSKTPSIGPTAATEQAGEIVFALITSGTGGLGQLVVNPAWGSNAATYSADATMNYSLDYRITTASETETVQWTSGATGAYYALLVASFKAVVAQTVVVSDGNVAAPTASFAALPAAGNAVVVSFGEYAGGGVDVASVTDNQGNTYTKAASSYTAGDGPASAIWYCPSIGTPSGTFTVTAGFTGGVAAYTSMILSEVAGGLATTGTVDLSYGAFDGSGLTTVTIGPTADTAQAREIVFGTICTATALAITSPTGYVNAGQNNNSGTPLMSTDYRITSVIETENPVWDVSVAGAAFGTALVSFKFAGSVTLNLGAAHGNAPSKGLAAFSQSLSVAARMRAAALAAASLSQQLPSQARAHASAHGSSALRQQQPSNGKARAAARGASPIRQQMPSNGKASASAHGSSLIRQQMPSQAKARASAVGASALRQKMSLAAVSRAASRATGLLVHLFNMGAAAAAGAARAIGALATQAATALVSNLKFYLRATRRMRSVSDASAVRTISATKRTRTATI